MKAVWGALCLVYSALERPTRNKQSKTKPHCVPCRKRSVPPLTSMTVTRLPRSWLKMWTL